MTEALADRVIERHRKRLHGRARRITIDMDPTDDPTHASKSSPFQSTTIATVTYRWFVFSPLMRRPSRLGGGGVAAWECDWFCGRARDSAPPDRPSERRLSQGKNSGATSTAASRPESFGFSGLRTESGIPRQHGRQCGVEAQGGVGHEAGSSCVGDLGSNRACLWRVPIRDAARLGHGNERIIYKAEVACAANRNRRTTRASWSPNLKTESAVDLRGRLTVKRGDVREQDQGTADGMQIGRTSCSNFFGEHLPGAA